MDKKEAITMTREGAIKILQHLAEIVLSKDYQETFKMAIAAIRPVSREQVERVWYRRGWEYDDLRADEGFMYSATNICKYCGSETPIGNFCYICGIAQTGRGVGIVMERLEALHENP